MAKYYRIQDVSREVSQYIAKKSLKTSPNGWRDIYAQEHATAFTVAKLKDLNLLGRVQKEITHSIEHGDTYKHFQKRMQPELQKWLDSVRRAPPEAIEGPELDKWKSRKDRYRLRRIFETNTRQAYSQHLYQRGMDNEFVSHVIYRIGPSINHRADHVRLDGLVLPKTDPMWDTHWPPNGWNCKCYVRFIGKKKLEQYRKDGVPDLQRVDHAGRLNKTKPIFETAPPQQYKWFTRESGLDIAIPADIDPGFEWNPGKFNRGTWLKEQALQKAQSLELEARAQRKLEQLIISNKAQKAAYEAFVEKYYNKKGPGAIIDVGIIKEALKKDATKRIENVPDSATIVMQDKVLNTKNMRHSVSVHGDSSVTKQEFLRVPEMLKKPDILFWDRMRQQYTMAVHTKERQLILLPLGINRIKAMKADYWTLRSAYRVDSYYNLIQEKYKAADNKKIFRYEIVDIKK